ncbi:MAG TPA: YggT family protein [Candidatus Limnocylindrales bacterium]|nr:YggT family protein [Candidatus Limnocylindrales bacterium]
MESFVRNFFELFFLALWLLIFGRVIMSFVDPMGRNQISAFLIQTTEPILGPVRRLLPQTGMFDFSPLIVLLVLGVLWRAL